MKNLFFKKKLFYGWVIVFLGMIIISVSYGIVMNCFSIYIKPIAESLGYSRQTVSLNLTIINIVLTVVSLLSGEIFKRFDLKRIMRASAIILPVAYTAYSFCTQAWMFYICSVFVGITNALLSLLPFTVIIGNWFEEKRGIALGICFMGSGVGGMLFNFIGGKLIVLLGWANMFRIYGLTMFLIIVPIIFIAIHVKPEDIGLLPLGVTENHQRVDTAEPEYNANYIMKSPRFWVLVIFSFAMGFSSSTISQTAIPNLSDKGFDVGYAANISAICMGGMAIGKVLLGKMIDFFGMKRSVDIALLAIMVGLFGSIMGGYKVAHIMILIGATLGMPVATVGLPGLSRESFGEKTYIKVNGYINAVGFLGVALTAYCSNIVFDSVGSYTAAYIFAGIMTLLAFALMTIVPPPENVS